MAIVWSRVMRSAVLQVKEQMYIESARAVGCRDASILPLSITPNIGAPVITTATLNLDIVILPEAALSFLGFGVPPPWPSWGRDSSDVRQYLEIAPHMAIFPGLTITIVVFAFKILGDAIRGVLDPQLRRTGVAS